MKIYLEGTGIFERWAVADLLLETASKKGNGIDVVETLTTNSLGATDEQKNFMFNRHEVLGVKLFDLLPACLGRIGGAPSIESVAVLPVLAQAASGAMPSYVTRADREVLASLRLASKKPLPKGFDIRTDSAENALALASYHAILSLEEVLRERPHRSANYAQSVVRLMVSRPGVVDTDAEYAWVFSRILDYY